MRKGIMYTAMLLCASLSLLITSCPVYADSSSEQVIVWQPYSAWIVYEEKVDKIIGSKEIVIVGDHVVQERYPEIEELLKTCEQGEWPQIYFEPDNVAELHMHIKDLFNESTKQNNENTGWKDDAFINGKISKPEDVKRNVIPNIFTYIINMHFFRSY